ncbi:spok [Drosophila busckii]|uniref:Spok n=1 Tax=Drosophila busckii TaxID=30019 RepID=A0A0M4E2Z0_DROBS|nr:spok [Drosophila busckii]
MLILGLISGIIAALICFSYVLIVIKCKQKANVKVGETIQKFKQAAGPKPWPIIGNLHIVGRYAHPFAAFTELTAQYGDIYALSFGHTRCLVVNNLELIREVLNKNGKYFGGRPNFVRYDRLFGGDRKNSLALCDWSQLQQRRRNLARRHCSPRESTAYYVKMSDIGCTEAELLMQSLKNVIAAGAAFDIKPWLLKACANMFSQYMCSLRFAYDDAEFDKIVGYFDEIFWEINQGYALDFLSWLQPFYQRHLSQISHWSSTIRKFILQRVMQQRELDIDLDEPDKDFTDALLKSLVEHANVSRNTIIFMLEDFIGGHSAVGNLVMLALAYIAKYPAIASSIQAEIDVVTNKSERRVNLLDMPELPYTMATLYEVLRYSSSPIVPHVATEDTQIAGHGVTTGTIIFINNYALNTSAKYWDEPDQFRPERFLQQTERKLSADSDSGIELSSPTYQLRKNLPHFLPFSIGKRTCIGQNLVRGFGFVLLANILQDYHVGTDDATKLKIYPASVALPAKCFSLTFKPR